MRILALDSESNALDWLMRCQQFGHDVIYWNSPRKDGSIRKTGENILRIERDFTKIRSKWLDWADLIYVPGNDKYLDMLEPYRRTAYPIYGSNAAAAEWEIDRAKGQAIMKACGLNVIPGKEFFDHDAAIAYVKKEGKPFVSKPNGEASKEMSYVATNAADLCYMLDRWKQNEKYRAAAKEFGFIIQQKVSGCEMGASGFFGPGGWLSVWEESFEFKKLMNDDLGVNTGEQGTLTRFVKQSKLADLVLKPLTAKLHEIEFVGCINVNCIIDDAGTPWPLEFTMRDGWPAKHNEVALQKPGTCPAQWKLDMLNGEDTLAVQLDTPCISVVLSTGHYPYSDLTAKEVEGIPIYGVADAEHVHLSEAYLGEAPCQAGGAVVTLPCYLTAGDYVVVVTGTGETITGARRSAYAAVRKIKIPGNIMYRTDIGKSALVEQLPKIQRHGYARGLAY